MIFLPKVKTSLKQQKLQYATILWLSICIQSRPCQALVLGGYSFEGNLNPTSSDSSVTFGNFTAVGLGSKNNFISGTSGQALSAGPWNANSPTTTGANVDSNPAYFQFSLTPRSSTLKFDSITFQISGNGSGADPNNIAVASSFNPSSGFTTIRTVPNPGGSTFQPLTLNFSGSSLQNTGVSSPIYFRIFGSGGTNGGRVDIDELRVTDTRAVPFGFSPSLGIVGLMVLFSSTEIYKRAKVKLSKILTNTRC